MFHPELKHTDKGSVIIVRNSKKLRQKYKKTSKTIGVGQFSKVILGYNRETKEKVAIKVLDKAKNRLSTSFDKNLTREIEIMKKIEHKNIIKLYDLYEDENYFFFVVEYAAGGELLDNIVERGHYTEEDARRAVRDIFRGVRYLHKNKITHRDLKPENILLSADGGLKIADFGLSTFCHSTELMMSRCGTPAYVAPEVITAGETGGYGRKVDSWSCGVISYVLLSGTPPFRGSTTKALLRSVVKQDYTFEGSEWEAISDDAKNFIRKLLTDEEHRMTAAQALQHPWLQTKQKQKKSIRFLPKRMKAYLDLRRSLQTSTGSTISI